MRKVSIIIPVYNVVDYIERCWKSVNAQTYSDIELIFVDDCGTDESISKLETLISEGSRFPVQIIKHNKNRGLSAARNTGIEASSGDYVYFLDSDDDLVSSCIEELVAPLGDYDYDFIIGDYNLIGDGGYSPLTLPEGGIIGNEKIIKAYAEGKWYVMAWNKLLNRSFLIENGLFFKEGIIHEDVLWNFKLACIAESMYVVPKSLYNYYVRKASIMTSMTIEKDLSVYLDVLDEICSFVKDSGRTEGRWEYEMIEGKKCGIMYSLLKLGETDLFKQAYPRFCRQVYIKPIAAIQKGLIGMGELFRDVHYYLPEHLGRIYKCLFYKILYCIFCRPLRGLVWSKQ